MPVLNDPPFRVGDLVICGIAHFTVKAGSKVRVTACVKSEFCESGWLIHATRQVRGKMPVNPSIAIEGIDSDWFTPINKAPKEKHGKSSSNFA